MYRSEELFFAASSIYECRDPRKRSDYPFFPHCLARKYRPRPVFPITPLISSPFFARAKVHHHSSLEEARTMRRGNNHLFPAKRLIFLNSLLSWPLLDSSGSASILTFPIIVSVPK
jgi:hypothetical protein